MHPGVTREFRMERSGEDVVLAHEDRVTVDGGEDLHFGSDLLDPRRSNEHGMDRIAWNAINVEVGLERVDLPPERIPLHHRIENSELVLVMVDGCRRQKDHAGAGTQRRHAAGDPPP